MKKIQFLTSLIFILSSYAHAMGIDDDPTITKVMGEIETSKAGGERIKAWGIEAWVGKDLEKVWIKSEGEIEGGVVAEGEIQVLHSRAVAPYWDFQYGIKKDFQPEPNRVWGVVGFKGLAPYLVEVDAALFVGKSGRTAARLGVEYEYMFTQKIVLSSEVEVNMFGKNDEITGTGKGLANIEAGLRLGYEVSREFMPYIGISWGKKYGNTAAYASNEGEDVEDARIVTGVHFWF
jgi:copper resistance protein B